MQNGCWAAAPITSLSVTLRGQRYDIDEVTTVRDLQEKLEQQSGINAKQQGRIIFGGKSLAADTVLEDAGVPNDGSASLTIVPASTNPSSKTKKKASSKKSTTAAAKSSSSTSSSSSGTKVGAKDPAKMPNFDKGRVEEMMQKMGKDGMPSLEESIKSMAEAMVSF
jgi:anti-sigma28 factor (negative regulator of flagellin synthesis)